MPDGSLETTSNERRQVRWAYRLVQVPAGGLTVRHPDSDHKSYSPNDGSMPIPVPWLRGYEYETLGT